MNEVSTVDFFPLAWVIHFARALMTFNIVNAMNKKKFSMPKTFFVFISVCMVYSYLTLQLNDKSEFVERFLELSLFYGLSSPLNSEMICIFPVSYTHLTLPTIPDV